MEQPDVQLGNGQIGDFKTAHGVIFPVKEDVARRATIAFHEDRLNWRLQRAFEDCFPGRAFQQPRPARPRPAAAKPAGFA